MGTLFLCMVKQMKLKVYNKNMFGPHSGFLPHPRPKPCLMYHFLSISGRSWVSGSKVLAQGSQAQLLGPGVWARSG